MIIQSMLDTDQYKCSMGWAVLSLFSNVQAEYRFVNRGTQRFNKDFVKLLKDEIKNLSQLSLTQDEKKWFKEKCPYIPAIYFEYLQNYRFNPEQIEVNLTEDQNLDIRIKGPWCETIYYEVPLMAIISELYFKVINTNWNMDGQIEKAQQKAKILEENDCMFSDFGSRRRRSFEIHDLVVNELRKAKTFKGSSNIHLCHKYNLTPIGTVAHEWISAHAILESMNHPNYYAMYNWVKIYGIKTGVFLPDTFTTDSFLKNFNIRFAKLFDGVRHDSNCPYIFADKIINHYKKICNIDPITKTIIFSDNLNVEKAVEIRKHYDKIINCAFGIGTNFSNDVIDSKPLNIVVKLWKINGVFATKLSDTKGKETGDPESIRIMNWIHRGEPL